MLTNKKILLKISGEFLGEPKNFPNMEIVTKFIQSLQKYNVELSIVVGGGNIIRGKKDKNRNTTDQMGMLATIINGLAITNWIHDSVCLSSIEIPGICERYSIKKAEKIIEDKKIPIFVGGIGCSRFSTDTAGVLRAIEMKCDFMLKATKVDGVYDADPKNNSNAKFLHKVSYDYVIENNLGIMDLTSVILARDNQLKICVFSIEDVNIDFFVKGQDKFSIIE